MKYYSHKKQYGGQIGATAGSSIGAATVAAIPGVGPFLSPLGGTVGGIIGQRIGSSFDKKPKKVIEAIEGSNFGNTFAKGGALPIGKGARKYVGPKHSKGGIPVDENGTPTKRKNAVAEVEGGETVQNGYVFSDKLIVPGTEMTFAQAHKQLLAEGATEEIEQLAQMQEQMNGQSQMTADQPMVEGDVPELDDGGDLETDPIAPTAPTDPKVKTWKNRIGENLGSFLPSVMRIGASIGAPRPTGYGRVSYRPLSTTSPTFANEQRRMDAGFRAASGVNPQAAYASYLDASSGLAAREAEFRAAREDANEQRRSQVEATNLDLRAREKQEREADMGQRISLALEGVSMPFQQRMMNRAAKRDAISKATVAAAAMPSEREASKLIQTVTDLYSDETRAYGGKIKPKTLRKYVGTKPLKTP